MKKRSLLSTARLCHAHLILQLGMPRLALGNWCVLSAPSCYPGPLPALPDQGSFPPCWEAEILPHHGDIYTASALREMSIFSALWKTHWKICVYPGMGLLLAWMPGSLALREVFSSCSSLFTGSSTFWVMYLAGCESTGAKIGTFWHSGVMLWL